MPFVVLITPTIAAHGVFSSRRSVMSTVGQIAPAGRFAARQNGPCFGRNAIIRAYFPGFQPLPPAAHSLAQAVLYAGDNEWAKQWNQGNRLLFPAASARFARNQTQPRSH
jgi:hypothetical protein